MEMSKCSFKPKVNPIRNYSSNASNDKKNQASPKFEYC